MPNKPKVYDCFAFFNELDLLELRLETLSPLVDKFVLVEATRTFQKQEKRLHFMENRERFKKYLPKIEHIVVNKYPTFFKKLRKPKAWDYDNSQKEHILQGLSSARDEDWVIVSDLDEIPRPESIRQGMGNPGINVFQQRLYYYYLNYECTYIANAQAGGAQENKDGKGWWKGSVMMPYGKLKKLKTIKKARLQRDKTAPEVNVLEDGGWHFAYLGGVSKIILKLESYTHPEHNKPEYKDPKRIERRINQGLSLHDESKFEAVPLDEHFPAPLLENPEKYEAFIYDLRANG